MIRHTFFYHVPLLSLKKFKNPDLKKYLATLTRADLLAGWQVTAPESKSVGEPTCVA